MSEPGFNMGHSRSSEFAKWVLHGSTHVSVGINGSTHGVPETIKAARWGSLRFTKENTVRSYDMLIGRVFREHKIVFWNQDAQSHSRTTTVHLGSVLGAQYRLPGWMFVAVNSETIGQDPITLLASRWGKKVKAQDLPNLCLAYEFAKQQAERTVSSSPQKTYGARVTESAEEQMRAYVSATKAQRQAMLGIYELANEQRA